MLTHVQMLEWECRGQFLPLRTRPPLNTARSPPGTTNKAQSNSFLISGPFHVAKSYYISCYNLFFELCYLLRLAVAPKNTPWASGKQIPTIKHLVYPCGCLKSTLKDQSFDKKQKMGVPPRKLIWTTSERLLYWRPLIFVTSRGVKFKQGPLSWPFGVTFETSTGVDKMFHSRFWFPLAQGVIVGATAKVRK